MTASPSPTAASDRHTTIVASASRQARYNISLQMLIRIVTFALNAFVLRTVSRETYGVVNVRLL
jgi:oligosaccharide translocation protein RFT1